MISYIIIVEYDVGVGPPQNILKLVGSDVTNNTYSEQTCCRERH